MTFDHSIIPLSMEDVRVCKYLSKHAQDVCAFACVFGLVFIVYFLLRCLVKQQTGQDTGPCAASNALRVHRRNRRKWPLKSTDYYKEHKSQGRHY